MSDPIARFIRIRPLATLGVSAVFGCIAGAYGGMGTLIWVILLAVTALVFLLRGRTVYMMLAILFSFAAVTSVSLPKNNGPELSGVEISGTVTGDITHKDTYDLVMLRDPTVDGQKLGYGIRVKIYEPPEDLFVGDKITFTGTTWRPTQTGNPGAFDYPLWLWRNGVGLCATCSGGRISSLEKGFALDTIPALCKKALGQRIDAIFGEQAALARALLLSDKTELEDSEKDAFRLAGMAHILAVSGLHISCLALFLDFLLRKVFRMGRFAALWVTLGLLVVYGAIIGYPPSVVRASLMYLVARYAPRTGKPSDTLTNLSLAALCILTVKPLEITNAGFQLSFICVASIVLCVPILRKALRLDGDEAFQIVLLLRPRKFALWLGKRALLLFLTGVVATMGSLPIIAAQYGSVSLLSPITGIIALPLVTLALPFTMLALLLCNIPILGAAFVGCARAMLWLLTFIAETAAKWTALNPNMPAWPVWLLLVYYLAVMLIMPHFHIHRAVRAAALAVVFACVFLVYPIARCSIPMGLELRFLDAGQAESIVVHADRRTYLVDVGTSGSSVSDYLLYAGETPEAVFLTHPHYDHAGGIANIVETCPSIKRIYLPCAWDYCEHDGVVDTAMENIGDCEIVYIGQGDTVALSDDITAEVLYPAWGDYYDDANDASLVLLLRYGNGTAILTGDVSVESAPELPDTDVLAVAHHGSKNNTTYFTAMQATPSVSVISVGTNSYGHPAQSVLEHLEKAGSAIYRTDEDGMVTVRIDTAGSVEVSTYWQGGTVS